MKYGIINEADLETFSTEAKAVEAAKKEAGDRFNEDETICVVRILGTAKRAEPPIAYTKVK